MNLISTEPIFQVHAELADIRDFGRTPLGHRRVIDILGGRVDGPKLSGRILPGADWQIVWADGTVDLDRNRRPRPGTERRAAPWPGGCPGGACTR
jgi:hypothetical protein